MGTLVSYQLEDRVATLRMDDGKVNALSPAMLADLNDALDRAEADRAVVVLTGREGVFSAGFDLRVLRSGNAADAAGMVRGGFELAERMLAFPTPLLIACTGHAIAMGSFLLLSGDLRIGAAGPFRIRANEVAIGLIVPQAAIEICRQRLAPAQLSRALVLSDTFDREQAVAAGFLDRVVPAAELQDAARTAAGQCANLDMNAHAATKRRIRAGALAAIRAAIEADADELARMAAPAS